VLLTDVRWIYSVLWVTVALATLVQGIFLRGMANAVVDIRQAKRLFPIFNAGGILGPVIGGLLTRPLASTIGTPKGLFVWAGGLGVTFALCRLVLGPPPAIVRHRTARKEASPIAVLALCSSRE
jgi:hypothetical protein